MDESETEIYHSILVALLLVGLVIAYFFYVMIRQQRRNRERHRLHLQHELNAIFEERQRIADDLHDDLGPYLSAVAQKLHRLVLKREQASLKTESLEHISYVMNRIRRITKDLQPYSARMGGPIAAIQDFIEKLNHPRLKILLECKCRQQFEDKPAAHVYRILIEIINNTIKHSEASLLNIVLEDGGDNLVIKTSDNGIGFMPARHKGVEAGIGLKIMENRVRQLGGKMTIESVSDRGTAFNVTLPTASILKQNDHAE